MTKEKKEKVQIIAEEITITSSENLNFPNFKIGNDGELVNMSRKVFDSLCEQTPNIKRFVEKGVIKIV